MTSAFSASFMKIAWPCGLLRLSVIAFLLRCRFWKSKPWRWPPMASVLPSEGGSILITCAPQSASWRTAVGPARCAVRSRTEMWDRGRVVMGGSSLFLVVLSAAKDLIAACHGHEILRCAQDDSELFTNVL